ncbi:hypothetical protein NLM24_35860 [Nocardia zapadnayensis]|uniref:5-formyltetrahydrofolate cyclo-ligase n=1 Tax=Brevibacterium sp. R8603A2 TaxID=2929779 RepID=UPI001FF8F66B|nr:5-formyltetrahydrofolate cyclo-ligase [Nocardia zapadnayensis]MCK1801667.1 hypothetical protein [Brevibacterium sp. R8603A2]MCX0275958.1 hypothetical protein [Nocardia zapadnayensis]
MDTTPEAASSEAADKARLRRRVRTRRRERARAAAEALAGGAGVREPGAGPTAPGEPERFAAVLAEVLAGSRAVLGYASLAGEPCLDLALDQARAAGAAVLLPLTTAGRPLDFGVLTGPMSTLPRTGKWQIREPRSGAPAAEALAGEMAGPAGRPLPPVDTILVPGLAFSRAGVRLGNGGGFYDRTFGPRGAAPPTGCGAQVLGVCFAEELVDALPHQPWDLRVDAVVTERGIVPVGVRRSPVG